MFGYVKPCLWDFICHSASTNLQRILRFDPGLNLRTILCFIVAHICSIGLKLGVLGVHLILSIPSS